MHASEFNGLYQPGSHFIYQSCSALRGGVPVHTVDIARDVKGVTVVQINVQPYFTSVDSLTPVEIKPV
ncbi:hypothetical protein [Erwinia typographi]|uniref:hypothetical protein n=1 Tax=Erwinia typographi TaxID=371042 RepID=UPI0009079EF4|nr:hypothetical protein [Erwinia typographi]